MQITSKTNSILAGIKQPVRETCPKLSAVLKVFQLQEETRKQIYHWAKKFHYFHGQK